MNKFTLATLFALLILTNFQVRAQGTALPTTNEQIFTSFPSVKSVALTTVCILPKYDVRTMLLLGKDLLVVNLNQQSKNVLSLVSPQNGKITSLGLPRGMGSNEILVPLQAGKISDKLVWLFDPMLAKLMRIDISKNASVTKQQKLPTGFYGVQVLSDTTLLANGEHTNNNKLEIVNTKTGKRELRFGEYAGMPEGFNPSSWKHAHEGFLYLKPDRRMAVVPYNNFDKVEIFDVVNNKNSVTVGPVQLVPSLQPMFINGMHVAMANEGTISAYTGAYCTNNYIYLLYSGVPQTSLTSEYAKQVFVLNWNGEPVQRIDLPIGASSICVTDNDAIMYIFDPKGSAIKMASLR